jgi:ureidoglycolate lyase
MVTCHPPDPEAFAAFGTFVRPPGRFGERTFFSDHLGGRADGAEPVLHVNKVRTVTLPHEVVRVERHPRADQVFLPLDVSRYLVVVMPSDTAGAPVPDWARAFLVPGNLGVIYHANVWHAGATVLDRPGSFAVLMWRRGDDGDDEFRAITPLGVVAPSSRPMLAQTISEDSK